MEIKFTKSKTVFRNINGRDVSDIEWKKRVEQSLETWNAKVSKVKGNWGIGGYVGADDIVYCLESELLKINSQQTWQDQPTEDGYYLFYRPGGDLDFVNVTSPKDKRYVEFLISGWTEYLKEITGNKWYGPITPPKED